MKTEEELARMKIDALVLYIEGSGPMITFWSKIPSYQDGYKQDGPRVHAYSILLDQKTFIDQLLNGALKKHNANNQKKNRNHNDWPFGLFMK